MYLVPFGLFWFGLVWFGLDWISLVWRISEQPLLHYFLGFGLVWFWLDWIGLVWSIHPLLHYVWGGGWFGLVWIGLLWFGLDWYLLKSNGYCMRRQSKFYFFFIFLWCIFHEIFFMRLRYWLSRLLRLSYC